MKATKTVDTSEVNIHSCQSPDDWTAARAITNQYVEWLAIDLSFQDFRSEMEYFEQVYGPPDGCYLLARIDGHLAGGVGLRKIDTGICEMKRMYVFEDYRETGIGRKLCEVLIRKARNMGYRKMRLDTLKRLDRANRLYTDVGFYEIAAYRLNPEPDVRYMEYVLV